MSSGADLDRSLPTEHQAAHLSSLLPPSHLSPPTHRPTFPPSFLLSHSRELTEVINFVILKILITVSFPNSPPADSQKSSESAVKAERRKGGTREEETVVWRREEIRAREVGVREVGRGEDMLVGLGEGGWVGDGGGTKRLGGRERTGWYGRGGCG